MPVFHLPLSGNVTQTINPWTIFFNPMGGQLAQFLIDHREQLLVGFAVAQLDAFKDSGNIIHGPPLDSIKNVKCVKRKSPANASRASMFKLHLCARTECRFQS